MKQANMVMKLMIAVGAAWGAGAGWGDAGLFGGQRAIAASLTAIEARDERVITTIGLGSCIRPDWPDSALDAAARVKPDVFVFLGDNIYGDSRDMDVLRRKWGELGANRGFKQLREQGTMLLATWDDHDFGENDAGNDYEPRAKSQQVFLDFWEEPADSPRRSREGIYDAKVIGPEGQRLLILTPRRSLRLKVPVNRDEPKVPPAKRPPASPMHIHFLPQRA
jgi:alkaline phosphatase D